MEILARTDRSGLDPAQAFVAFGEGQVYFAEADHSCHAFLSTCGNPDCGCSDVQITIVDPVAGARFAVKVDLVAGTGHLETGTTRNDPERTVAEIVEAVRGPVAEAVLRRLKCFRMRKPDVGRLHIAPDFVASHGGLLPLSHLLAGGRPNPRDGYAGFYDRLEVDGESWVIQDMFCGRKGCDCREAMLDFHRTTDQRGVFGARMDLTGGGVELESLEDVEPDLARRVLARWRAASPKADRKVLTARYKALRELAGRPLPDTGTVDAPRLLSGKDPCPCGSGKRYKRCCGAR